MRKIVCDVWCLVGLMLADHFSFSLQLHIVQLCIGLGSQFSL